MKQIFIKAVLSMLLLVAASGCATPSSGGYGNQSRSSAGHQH